MVPRVRFLQRTSFYLSFPLPSSRCPPPSPPSHPEQKKYLRTSAPIGFRTHQNPVLVAFWREKSISTPGNCSGLIALARTFMSHDTALQERIFHHAVLIGFGTHHEFRNELMTGTEVPLWIHYRPTQSSNKQNIPESTEKTWGLILISFWKKIALKRFIFHYWLRKLLLLKRLYFAPVELGGTVVLNVLKMIFT